jgi:hypothetical protein
MSDTSTGSQYDAGGYEIRVGGRLDQRWSVLFDGMTLTNERDGTTNIQGPVADQAALHGLLTKLRDIGLPLVSVTQVRPGPLAGPQSDPR